ncbi:MAG: eCIS core domain-containing protein [Pyrinomonadaceae bacterium]
MGVHIATSQPAKKQRVDPQRATPGVASQVAGFSARSPIHQLQRAVGNRAMDSLLRSPIIQPKLTISRPSDVYEREADGVADEVMRMPEPPSGLDIQRSPLRIHRPCYECENELQGQPEQASRDEGGRDLVQAKREPGSAMGVRVIRTRDICQQRERKLHRQTHDEETGLQPGEEPFVQAKRAPSDAPSISNDLESYLASSRGVGQPLPAATRSFFEPRFGHDFSHVRVHSDGRATQAAREIRAQAFTAGPDVYFASGRYNPGSVSGQRLLSHELTHVVQQGYSQPTGHTSGVDSHLTRRSAVDASLTNASFLSARLEVQRRPEDCPSDRQEDPTHPGTCPDVRREQGESRRFKALGPNVREITPLRCYVIENLPIAGVDFGAMTGLEEIADFLVVNPGVTLHLTGFTDCLGSPSANANLRTNRASAVEDYFVMVLGVDRDRVFIEFASDIEYLSTNETAMGRAANRAVALYLESGTAPTPRPGPTPVPVPDNAPANCTPPPGLPPTECSLYRANEYWLPSAYVHNATCACQETPNSTTANCVRKFLQDRLAATPQSEKDFWSRMKQLEFMSKAEYDQEILQRGLINRIFEDHVDAYSNCCCPSGPAPFTAWIGVSTTPLGCQLVGMAIRRAGSCHGTPGAW